MWYRYLLPWAVVSLVATCFNWLFIMFYTYRYGPLDNANSFGFGPRLPRWLAWFDTPDNALLGDHTWQKSHSETYWDLLAWLNRNKIYGFQWTVLAAVTGGEPRTISGNPMVNHHTGVTGVLRISCKEYWQYKAVLPIALFPDYCWIFNFGWLLDDSNALYPMYICSIRIRKLGV